ALPITRQLDSYYQVLAESDAAYKKVERHAELEPEKVRPALLTLFTKDPLVRGTEFQKKLPVSWKAWEKATEKELQERLEKLGQARRKLLDLKTDLEVQGKTLSPEQARELREGEFEADLGSLEQILRRYEARPWEKLAKEDLRRLERTKLFRLVSYSAEL